MSKNRISPERVVILITFVFLSVALYASLNLTMPENTIFPTQLVPIFVHAVCVVLSAFLIFKPVFAIELFIMLVESFLTVTTTYPQLGIFLFYGAVILCFIKEKFKTNPVPKLAVLGILHFSSIILCYKQGLIIVLLTFASSFFYGVFFLWIYDILKTKLACFMPAKISQNVSISGIKPGSDLSLSKYNLSSRQIDFILDNLHNNCSYKDLSEKYFVSLSTVKKDFAEMFKIFGVTKLEELHLLLLQYHVIK